MPPSAQLLPGTSVEQNMQPGVGGPRPEHIWQHLKLEKRLEKPMGPRRLTRAHAQLRRLQQRRATEIPPTETDASMVPPPHSGGVFRAGELEKAKPSPGHRRLPEATAAGAVLECPEDRASSGSTSLPSSRVVARAKPNPESSGLQEPLG